MPTPQPPFELSTMRFGGQRMWKVQASVGILSSKARCCSTLQSFIDMPCVGPYSPMITGSVMDGFTKRSAKVDCGS